MTPEEMIKLAQALPEEDQRLMRLMLGATTFTRMSMAMDKGDEEKAVGFYTLTRELWRHEDATEVDWEGIFQEVQQAASFMMDTALRAGSFANAVDVAEKDAAIAEAARLTGSPAPTESVAPKPMSAWQFWLLRWRVRVSFVFWQRWHHLTRPRCPEHGRRYVKLGAHAYKCWAGWTGEIGSSCDWRR